MDPVEINLSKRVHDVRPHFPAVIAGPAYYSTVCPETSGHAQLPLLSPVPLACRLFFFFPFCFHQAPSCTHFDDIIWAVGLVRARPRRLAGVTHGRTPISQSGCFFLPGLVSPTVLLFTGTDYSWWLHLNHIRFISFICCLPYHAQGG